MENLRSIFQFLSYVFIESRTQSDPTNEFLRITDQVTRSEPIYIQIISTSPLTAIQIFLFHRNIEFEFEGFSTKNSQDEIYSMLMLKKKNNHAAS